MQTANHAVLYYAVLYYTVLYGWRVQIKEGNADKCRCLMATMYPTAKAER